LVLLLCCCQDPEWLLLLPQQLLHGGPRTASALGWGVAAVLAGLRPLLCCFQESPAQKSEGNMSLFHVDTLHHGSIACHAKGRCITCE
jgi:hypothetical protein